ncbi:MAG: E3 binding domain-containing protein, partial [Eubacteriales bacterium]|nr:E3 binding domain-containing protein [Eubacteriales bacterium]
MATPIIMPRQGQSVESCLIGKWHKQVGDSVAAGDLLFTYETDKATFDETAKVSGTMLAIFAAEGDDVPCLQNVCVIGQPGDSFAQFDPSGASAAAAPETATPVAAIPSAAPSAPAVSAGDLPAGEPPEKISPRARVLAEKSGADLRQAMATGPQGRVIARDVEALVAAGKVSTGAVGTAYPAGLAGTGLGGAVSIQDLSAPVAAAAPAATPVAAAAVA